MYSPWKCVCGVQGAEHVALPAHTDSGLVLSSSQRTAVKWGLIVSSVDSWFNGLGHCAVLINCISWPLKAGVFAHGSEQCICIQNGLLPLFSWQHAAMSHFLFVFCSWISAESWWNRQRWPLEKLCSCFCCCVSVTRMTTCWRTSSCLTSWDRKSVV